MCNKLIYRLKTFSPHTKILSFFKCRYQDDLTGLPNRSYLRKVLSKNIAKQSASNIITLALIDFKPLHLDEDNISLDNDLALKKGAKVLTKKFNNTETSFFRYDAHTIAVLFRGKTKQESDRIIIAMLKELEKIDSSINRHNLLTPNIGIASYPVPANSIKKLVAMAEIALNDIKQHNYSNTSRFTDVFSLLDTKNKSEEEFLLITRTLLKIVDLMDHYTYSHTLRVVNYCELIANELGLSKRDRKNLYLGALLHDVGKLGVGKEILLKTSPLSKEEWNIIKQHPVLSAQMIEHSGHFPHISKIVKHHHENFDGSGYPDGLKEETIPFESRIISIADSFDAITTNRPYKAARSAEEAFKELEKCSFSQFDPILVQVFIRVVS